MRSGHAFVQHLITRHNRLTTPAARQMLLDEQVSMIRSSNFMALVMVAGLITAGLLAWDTYQAEINPIWYAINLILTVILLLDAAHKIKGHQPSRPSFAFLKRAEAASFVFGFSWASIVFCLPDHANLNRLIALALVIAMVAGFSGLNARAPRCSVRYAAGAFTCILLYSVLVPSYSSLMILIMCSLFIVSLTLGVRESFQAYRSELEHKAESGKLSTLLSSSITGSPHAIALFDPEKKLILSNEGFRALGCPVDLSHAHEDLIHLGGSEYVLTVTPIPETGFLVTLVDVTAIQKSQDELRDLNDTCRNALNVMNTLINQVTTQIRSKVSGSRVMLEALRNGLVAPDSPKFNTLLDTCIQDNTQVSRIIDSLRLHGEYTAEPDASCLIFNPSTLINEVLDDIPPYLIERSGSYVSRPPDDQSWFGPTPIRPLKAALHSAFADLIERHRTRIEIRTYREDAAALFFLSAAPGNVLGDTAADTLQTLDQTGVRQTAAHYLSAASLELCKASGIELLRWQIEGADVYAVRAQSRFPARTLLAEPAQGAKRATA